MLKIEPNEFPQIIAGIQTVACECGEFERCFVVPEEQARIYPAINREVVQVLSYKGGELIVRRRR